MRFSATDVFQSAVVVIPARAPREPSLPRGASPTRLPGLTLRTDLQPLFLFLLGKKRCPRTLSYLSHPRSGVSRFSEELRRVSGRSACEARGTRSGCRGVVAPGSSPGPGPDPWRQEACVWTGNTPGVYADISNSDLKGSGFLFKFFYIFLSLKLTILFTDVISITGCISYNLFKWLPNRNTQIINKNIITEKKIYLMFFVLNMYPPKMSSQITVPQINSSLLGLSQQVNA